MRVQEADAARRSRRGLGRPLREVEGESDERARLVSQRAREHGRALRAERGERGRLLALARGDPLGRAGPSTTGRPRIGLRKREGRGVGRRGLLGQEGRGKGGGGLGHFGFWAGCWVWFFFLFLSF